MYLPLSNIPFVLTLYILSSDSVLGQGCLNGVVHQLTAIALIGLVFGGGILQDDRHHLTGVDIIEIDLRRVQQMVHPVLYGSAQTFR